jgi:urea transport system permease protein
MLALQVGFKSSTFVGIVRSIELVIACVVGELTFLPGVVYGSLLVNWAKTTFSEDKPQLWLLAIGE